ncbi:MAG: hypothetical protein NTX50_20860 [Candidatus Sumerlaeota bacterium]|nr:hypothetical protein [Candidatus Sumerlaeota bacterium]
MATYEYKCDCMKKEVEVAQPMSEPAFTSCLQVYERLGRKAPARCVERGGDSARRLIAGSAGVIISKGPRQSCSLGEKASQCGSCCSASHGAQAACPFG